MEKIPENLKQCLIEMGYDAINKLPNNPDSTRWDKVQAECNFSTPQMNQVINALFPPSTPTGIYYCHL
jgi:hypothetical protein